VQIFNPPSICLAENRMYELGTWHVLLFFFGHFWRLKSSKITYFWDFQLIVFLSGDNYIAREKEAAL
jgi:hypothetical protein